MRNKLFSRGFLMSPPPQAHFPILHHLAGIEKNARLGRLMEICDSKGKHGVGEEIYQSALNFRQQCNNDKGMMEKRLLSLTLIHTLVGITTIDDSRTFLCFPDTLCGYVLSRAIMQRVYSRTRKLLGHPVSNDAVVEALDEAQITKKNIRAQYGLVTLRDVEVFIGTLPGIDTDAWVLSTSFALSEYDSLINDPKLRPYILALNTKMSEAGWPSLYPDARGFQGVLSGHNLCTVANRESASAVTSSLLFKSQQAGEGDSQVSLLPGEVSLNFVRRAGERTVHAHYNCVFGATGAQAARSPL